MKDLRLVFDHGGFKVYRATLPPIGVNTYFLTDDTTLLVIDPGTGAFDLVRKGFEQFEEATGILITHTHYDHIAGLREFPRKRIFLSQAAKPGLFSPEKNLSQQLSKRGLSLSQDEETVLVLSEGPTDVGSLRFETWILPGHTPGDALFDFGCCLFTGDILFENSIGRTDFPGASERAMSRSLRRLYTYLKTQQPNKPVFPGHMNAFTVRDALERNPYLAIFREIST
ncbi:MAG TPA: MBL fold metallo-hydrolase [Thermotogota bacterium]|nr:MBL fold metallo-hydrolase [Thermotogota bacterium]NLH20421.1 MBL fold metallo-hydrolase [Thermotogaceae bacterium]OQC32793.1 MAG: putative metallo-hydrolase [Thermotogota bacterium ADurb.Bin062]HNW46913.1 MBL fold metallo-hydrolase [Thermotogota bacterium]HNY81681.1 MBL fold metallo-hydrolase [Thermotogota bacterium]